jgi:hypothetical protein
MNKTQVLVLGLGLMCAHLVLSELPLAPGNIAYAAPITTINGTISATTLTSPDPESFSHALLGVPGPLQLAGILGVTTNLDGVVGAFPTSISALSITRNPITGPPGFTSFSVGPVTVFPAEDKQIVNLPAPGGGSGGSVSFELNLNATTARVPTNPALFNTLVITGTEVLLAGSTLTTLDFSAFNHGDFTLTFQAAPGTDLAAVITSPPSGGQTVTVTGSFSQHAAIPEPSALMLLGSGILGLLGYAWGRRWWRGKTSP